LNLKNSSANRDAASVHKDPPYPSTSFETTSDSLYIVHLDAYSE